MTTMKKTLKFKARIEVQQGQNCIKLKIWGQLEMKLKEIKKSNDQIELCQVFKLKP